MTFRQLRSLCTSLPEVVERETWGESTFRFRERIFVIGSPEGHSVSIKASLDDQAGLIAMDPDTFAVAAYTGRYGWVTVRLRTVGHVWGPRDVVAGGRPGDGRVEADRDQARSCSARSCRGYDHERRRAPPTEIPYSCLRPPKPIILSKNNRITAPTKATIIAVISG